MYIGAHHRLCVCHVPGNKVVFILDSLPVSNDLNDETIFQICKIYSPLSSKKGILMLQKLSTQRQCNDLDCGLFAIANMVDICYGNNPEDLSCDQDLMRKHQRRSQTRAYPGSCPGITQPCPSISKLLEFYCELINHSHIMITSCFYYT